ncbi:MAG: cation:proton antiporter [Candidatus Jorgensenbacteria bacterium]|nr:cation:proton antiporter [Candidatus Jorgensenbacteria bacterium]
MTSAVFNLAIVVMIGAAFGVIAKLLKQPTIIAYLATGIFIGSVGLFSVGGNETIRSFSELGIMLLLFLVGMEINYSSLRLVGRASLLIGVGQVIATFGAGYFLAHAFGFSVLSAIYIAIALTFSSTVIVVKLLSDKRVLNSLYGKISIGLLLFQDFTAILILVLLAGIQSGHAISITQIVLTIAKGAILFAVMLYLGRRILPYIFGKIAMSQELLFLVSLAWVFLVAVLVSKMGFSVEIAGFLAGIALANSSEHHQISARIRPLRDFFLIAFFVILGAQAVFSNFVGMILPIIAFSLFVLLIKPLIVFSMMGIFGYKKRTGFMTGIALAQISEFSLVLMALGLQLGHVDEKTVALITATGVISILLSSYMIQFSEYIYLYVRGALSIFERKEHIEQGVELSEDHKPIVLIGFHRLGESIAMGLPREKLLVIEFDPEITKKLKRAGYNYLFGDISDPEIFESAKVRDAELVISTSPDIEDNLTLLAEIRKLIKHPKVVLRAENEDEADALYQAGADYVLFPHLTSGQYFGKTIAINSEMNILEQLKTKDLAILKSIKKNEEF